jgi:NADP-dependent 3-hydroxy acid dehydrogenase YdfG
MRRGRNLAGAVVVITGASSGSGRATALAFADHGAKLVLAARGQEALEDAAKECRGRAAAALAVPTDVGDPDAVERLARRAVGEFGRIDVWVEAAGVVVAAPLGRETPEDLQRLIQTNVGGAVFGSRTALKTFRAQGSGTLINIASMLALTPNPVVPAYVMTKFAVRGLSLSLQQAVSTEPNIEVCVVLPGPVDTPLFQRAANLTGRQLRAIPPAYAPERVAAAIVSCARRPRRQVVVGAAPRLIALGHRIAPRPTEWAVARVTMRTVTRARSVSETRGALFEPPAKGAIHGGWRRGRLRRRLGENYGRWLASRGSTSDETDSLRAPAG